MIQYKYVCEKCEKSRCYTDVQHSDCSCNTVWQEIKPRKNKIDLLVEAIKGQIQIGGFYKNIDDGWLDTKVEEIKQGK